MTIYKRGGSYWADFTIAGRRYRIPLKASNKQEAANLEKLRIGEAQSHGGLFPSKTAKLTVAEAGDLYFQRREGEVSASTVRLERDGFKQVKRHLGSNRLSSINLESIGEYTHKRKKQKIGNRTINIEIGVLRRVMKQHKLWSRVADDYKRLPEPKNIGCAGHPNRGKVALRPCRKKQVPSQDDPAQSNRLVGGRAAARPSAQSGFDQPGALLNPKQARRQAVRPSQAAKPLGMENRMAQADQGSWTGGAKTP